MTRAADRTGAHGMADGMAPTCVRAVERTVLFFVTRIVHSSVHRMGYAEHVYRTVETARSNIEQLQCSAPSGHLALANELLRTSTLRRAAVCVKNELSVCDASAATRRATLQATLRLLQRDVGVAHWLQTKCARAFRRKCRRAAE